MKNTLCSPVVAGELVLVRTGLACFAFSACARDQPEHGTAEAWSYDHEEDWPVLGKKELQSPIELSLAGGTAKLPGTYGEQDVEKVKNNGHSIQLDYATSGGSLVHEGTSYELVQFHFHAPSEHQQKGYAGWKDTNGGSHPGHYAMEVHFVHSDGSFEGDVTTASTREDLLVVGVFVEQGSDENPELEEIWKKLPMIKQAGDEVALDDGGFDARALMPKDSAYLTYAGSLTTPPCSDGVSWIVMDKPIEASASQVEVFRSTMGHDNNRSVQDLHGRVPVAVPGK